MTLGHAPPRRGPATVFVGRRAELALVDAAREDARAGTPRLVWIAGPAGAGKTALIERCVARHAPGPALTAAGDDAETALPHALLDQLVTGLPAGLAQRFALLRRDRDPRVDPLAVGADLLAALDAVAGGTSATGDPLLLVVDDVQWVDAASAGVLAFVLRRLRHDRILALIGQRTTDRAEQDDAPHARMLAAGRDAVRRVRLAGLDTAEISELAASLGRPLGSTGAAERLRHHTQGHPMHVRALLEEMPTEALVGSVDVLPAPRSFRSVVLARLARLGEGGRGLVVAASVLGEACPVGLAAAVAGLADEHDVAVALDEAVAADLLVERPGPPPGRLAFPHPLVRSAVHGDLAPGARRTLHAAAASLLTGRAALGHRVAAAVAPDPVLAAEVEALAADPSVELAGGEAADLLCAAADLGTGPEDRERRQGAAVARLVADGEIARAAGLEPLVEQWRSGPRRGAVLGQLALLTGRFGRARARLDAAVAAPATDVPDVPDGRARAVAAAHLALLDVVDGVPGRAVEGAGTALAAGAGDPAVRLPAGLALVLGLAASGRDDAARAVLDGAVPDGAPEPVDVLIGRGILDALADDDPAAERHLLAAVRRARAGEPVRAPALALAFLPAVQDRLGHGEGVVEAGELAVSLARDGGTALPGTLARAFVAEALAVRGRGDEARAHLAAAAADGPHWWGGAACLAVAAAVLAEVEGDHEAMLRALAPTRAPDVRDLTDGLGMLAPRVLEIDALLGLGRRDEASTLLDALAALVATRSPGRHALDAARLRLVLDPAPAGREDFSDARLGAVRAPLARARWETEVGRRLLAAGERRAGVDVLRTARDRLAGIGAVPWRRRCDDLLHGAGLTPSPAREALGLTAHEEAVVALVARGMTNREVGRALFVTPRTVAYHLSNVYAKLGVTSRRELAALVTGG